MNQTRENRDSYLFYRNISNDNKGKLFKKH